jgi:hypothetical protein
VNVIPFKPKAPKGPKNNFSGQHKGNIHLTSVSRLDDQDVHCHFGDRQCIVQFSNKDVGLAVLQDMLYLLSPSDVVNVLYTPENDPANSGKKRKRGDGESSSKLRHYCLGHVLRGE